ncbi:MAG: Uma2 family endonuclease [Aphanocapsa sp. GSE-SYN-MK-11-07L]|nr:Uma2 family endonuclease [Aphanocapsa sp. GSE-SYN-MK-11-07L]
MIAQPSHFHLSAEEYLQTEAKSPLKHEYVNGQIYAMAGASDSHVTIAGNLFALLRSHVRGGPCRVFMSDMKARIESLNTYYYPDVMVTCDDRDRVLTTCKRYPRLIVEVLSQSTEGFDRGDKFADYQQLETLQEYVLISSHRQRVDCFRRNPEGLWVMHSFLADREVSLVSLNFKVAIADLYEDVSLEAIQKIGLDQPTTQKNSSC